MRAPRPRAVHWTHAGFWAACVLSIWDLYETILAAGDTPFRIHHGYIGLAGMAVFWITSHWRFYFLGLRRLLRKSRTYGGRRSP